MGETAAQTEGGKAPISGLVPMIHVANVERSASFYKLLGFEIGNYVPREGPPVNWAWLYQPKAPNWKIGANLMLVLSERRFDRNPELYLTLYLYAADLIGLRQQLMTAGVKVSEISYPEYLPKGEFETHDPDGYTVMVGQSYEGSP